MVSVYCHVNANVIELKGIFTRKSIIAERQYVTLLTGVSRLVQVDIYCIWLYPHLDSEWSWLVTCAHCPQFGLNDRYKQTPSHRRLLRRTVRILYNLTCSSWRIAVNNSPFSLLWFFRSLFIPWQLSVADVRDRKEWTNDGNIRRTLVEPYNWILFPFGRFTSHVSPCECTYQEILHLGSLHIHDRLLYPGPHVDTLS